MAVRSLAASVRMSGMLGRVVRNRLLSQGEGPRRRCHPPPKCFASRHPHPR